MNWMAAAQLVSAWTGVGAQVAAMTDNRELAKKLQLASLTFSIPGTVKDVASQFDSLQIGKQKKTPKQHGDSIIDPESKGAGPKGKIPAPEGTEPPNRRKSQWHQDELEISPQTPKKELGRAVDQYNDVISNTGLTNLDRITDYAPGQSTRNNIFNW